MVPEYKVIYGRVGHKTFVLRKFRYFIDKKVVLLNQRPYIRETMHSALNL